MSLATAPLPASASSESPPEQGSVLQPLELAAVRERIRDRVTRANQTTECEVLALGAAVTTIVEQARAYEAEVRGQLDLVNNESGIDRALSSQAATIRELSGVLGERLGGLQAQAVEAEKLVRDILEIGVRISEISMASKTLALNARLEAARSADGDSFAVIANEMSALNASVQASNAEINSIAKSMLVALPDIRKRAAELHEEAGAYRDRLDQNAREVADGEAILRRALEQVQHLGEARIAHIVAESNRAADHLVFQDPVAQSLMRIDRELAWLEARARGKDEPDPFSEALATELEHEDVAEDGDFLMF